MSSRRDLLIQIESQFREGGFKSAEASAKALVRELDRVEKAERSLASMQIAALREDEARTSRRLAAMQSVGQGALLMGAAFAAGFGLAAKSARDWETAWTGVTKTVDGSAAEMAQLETELRSLAKALPSTHEEIAAVAEAAGQLGVKRGDIARFTKTMIDLGETTNLSADEAATSLAKLGNIMGVLPSQADQAGAALVALGNDGASTEKDILEMSLRIAAAGKTIGLTEAQVMGFASALSSVGIEAEAGGSAISRVMVDVAKAVDAGGDGLRDFASVAGMSAEQFTSAFRRDAAGAITAFIEGLGRMQRSGQSVFGVLENLGLSEIRVRDTLLRTANASDLVRKSVDLGATAWQKNTALVDEANKRYETAESRIATARNKLNDMAIDVGGVVLPALADVGDHVGALADLFTSLPEPVRTTITVLGVVAGTVALAGGAAMLAVPKFQALQATLQSMGARGAAVSRGLSSVVGVLGGPWGIALAAATIGLGAFVDGQAEAKQFADALRASLDEQTFAITGNTRALVAKKLQEDGYFAVANEMGVSIDDVTSAALGQADALERVNAQTKAYLDQSLKASSEDGALFDRASYNAEKLGKAVGTTSETLKQQIEKQRELQAATGKTAESQGNLTSAAGDLTKSTKDATTATLELIKAQQAQIDLFAGGREAERNYEAAVDSVEESLKSYREELVKGQTEKGKSKKAAEEFADAQIAAGKAMDIGTEAGRRNEAALFDLADRAKDAAEAQLKQGKSVDEAAKTMQSRRDQFIDLATRLTGNRVAAEQLADKLGLSRQKVQDLATGISNLPTHKKIEVTVDSVDALIQLGRLRTAAEIRGYIKLTASMEQRAAANGMLTMSGVRRMAAGDVTRDAVIMAQQSPIIWNEAPGGEAYIPLHPARRARSLEIWRRTGDLLGVPTAGAFTPGSSLAGIEVTGTLDTPFGPASVRGVVKQEVDRAVREAKAGVV